MICLKVFKGSLSWDNGPGLLPVTLRNLDNLVKNASLPAGEDILFVLREAGDVVGFSEVPSDAVDVRFDQVEARQNTHSPIEGGPPVEVREVRAGLVLFCFCPGHAFIFLYFSVERDSRVERNSHILDEMRLRKLGL